MQDQEFQDLLSREWLETNGVGGWASSTVAGSHTRRYHGLLVSAISPPADRRVLLSRLDETITVDGKRVELATRAYSDAVTPEGYRLLSSFTTEPFPTFEYSAPGFTLRKSVSGIHGQNTTVVVYQLIGARAPVTLELQPFLAGRDYHRLDCERPIEGSELAFEDGSLLVHFFPGCVPFLVNVPGSKFVTEPDWFYQFQYAEEAARGLDATEDLFTPGHFEIVLSPGQSLAVTITSETPGKLDGFALVEQEGKRRKSLLKKLPKNDSVTEVLALAADQFIVRRGTGSLTVIAGYHWFADWGRDTMIALPGLCLVTGRFTEAKAILSEFAMHVSQGMLPNRFSGTNSEPEYNTIDASLWYFVAAYRYYEYTGDKEFIREELLPVLGDIITWHLKGTRFNIQVTDDGLLSGGAEGVQLTWMDARIGDTPVTPRHGKPVEINALWYNALRIFTYFDEELGSSDQVPKLLERVERIRSEFVRQFWNEEKECLYDYLSGDHRDAQIRPNQLFALSLPFPLLEAEQAEKVLKRIEADLLTRFGLRTLAAEDPAFRPRCEGGLSDREGAYHQGTVWPWLLGPYLTALARFRGEDGIRQGRQILFQFTPHFTQAGTGSISEIFDGAAPHQPRGCIAQAWSVAELLRGYVEDVCGIRPTRDA